MGRTEGALVCETNDKENAMYCEIQYIRDRSGFAGIAFEITDKYMMLRS